ncbi:MAG: xanthine dehydrogenase family protein [Spirochaetales bacterium]|nr:xanthine dehydrogenase family protein [Spirochaetales bacterium]
MINFVSDIYPEGTLYGITVRSPVSKGGIVSIKIPKLPKGYFAVSADSIPGSRTINTHPKTCIARPWLAEENVNYKGEAVLLMAGPDRSALSYLAMKVNIKYRKEKAILNTVNAETVEEYLCRTAIRRRGNIESAFKNAYQIVEEEYSTGTQRQFHEEPQAAVSVWNGTRLLIISNTQDPFGVQLAVSEMLRLPKKKIRVLVPPVERAESELLKYAGDEWEAEANSNVKTICSNPGFNGRLMDSVVVAGHSALLSFVTGKPVRMVYSAEEDFMYAAKRYPVIARYKTALDEGGIPKGIKAEIVMDAGAYTDGAEEIFDRILTMAAGSYGFPNAEITGKLVKTDRIPFGVSVGSGTPQAFLGIELHSAKLAEISQLDPYIWKKKFLIENKGILPSGARLPDYKGAEFVLDSVVEKSDFRRKYAAYETLKKRRTALSDTAGPLRGIGLGLCFQGMNNDKDNDPRKYSLRMKLARDENIIVYSTFQNLELMQAVVLSAAGNKLGLKNVNVSAAGIDTDTVPDTGPAKPLIESVLIPRLVNECISAVQKKRFNSPLPIEVKKVHRIPAVLKKQIDTKTATTFSSVSWAAVVTEVELDPLSFEVLIRGIWVAVDGFMGGCTDISAGENSRCLKAAERGIRQDIVIGLNFAAGRGIKFESGGIIEKNIQNRGYMGILPDIDISFVKNEMHSEKNTGFVRTGVHGLSVAAVAPAYVSAVSQATGFYPNHLPVTPLTIQEYLESS